MGRSTNWFEWEPVFGMDLASQHLSALLTFPSTHADLGQRPPIAIASASSIVRSTRPSREAG